MNTRTRGVVHGTGRKAKWERHTKAMNADPSTFQSMHSGQKHGLDYTPLFRFLLSRVGRPWPETLREAIARLDRPDPIYWMVAVEQQGAQPYVRVGESSYYSGLYVDQDDRLAIVDSTVDETSFVPTCACCTHTFNGKTLTQPYRPDALSADQN